MYFLLFPFSDNTFHNYGEFPVTVVVSWKWNNYRVRLGPELRTNGPELRANGPENRACDLKKKGTEYSKKSTELSNNGSGHW